MHTATQCRPSHHPSSPDAHPAALRLACLAMLFFLAAPSLLRAAEPVASPVTAAASGTADSTATLPAPSPVAEAQTAQQEGDLAMAQHRYVAAIAAFKRAPDSAVVSNRIGIAYHHLFALEEARKHYQHALQLDPHYAEAFNNLGAVFYGENNLKQAEKAYQQAILNQPNMAMAYKNLGVTYFAANDSHRGAAAFHQALAIDPKIFSSRDGLVQEGASNAQLSSMNYALARIYAQSGNDDQALAALRTAVAKGFKDTRQLKQDQALARLSQTPAYQEALASH